MVEKMANLDAMYMSKSDEWSTPQNVYDKLNKEFNFNLDPCATPENAKCRVFYTMQQDGLKADWGGGAYFATRRIATLAHG